MSFAPIGTTTTAYLYCDGTMSALWSKLSPNVKALGLGGSVLAVGLLLNPYAVAAKHDPVKLAAREEYRRKLDIGRDILIAEKEAQIEEKSA